MLPYGLVHMDVEHAYMDDSEAQRILSEFYGVIVDESSAKLEIASLVLGHAAGTLDHAHQGLYDALVAAGQIQESEPH